MRPTQALFTLGALLLGEVAQTQAYTLHNSFDDTNFFHEFDFFSAPDPTHGFIQYASATKANSGRLAGFSQEGVYLGLDHTTMAPAGGRASTRVSSKATYNHGLFIADIAHMPGSICGVWPAFWLTAEDSWPNLGEIDIIEGVNTQMEDAVTLHTSAGCTMKASGTGNLADGNCNLGSAYQGCSTTTKAPYGDAFNDIGGGVYATEWTSDHISVWFFPRSSIPADITSGTPDPASWGKPIAGFEGGSGCNIDQHFKNHKIIFNIATCGDWAGNVWGSNPECAALAGSCSDYVAQNPAAFTEAYWLINSVKVFQQ